MISVSETDFRIENAIILEEIFEFMIGLEKYVKRFENRELHHLCKDLKFALRRRMEFDNDKIEKLKLRG